MIRPAAQEDAARTLGLDRKWWILIAIGVGTFMSALDGSVVNTILPVMRSQFGSDVASIEWVVTVYLLVVSGLLLSFGRLGDIRGHKILYASGFAVFVVGSALSGAASSVGMLIACRGLQALGAAMLFANSPAILTKNFPAGQRGQALGIQATMTYLGLTTGPVLGGWLASVFSWRAVFYINVPIGLLALWLSLHFIPRDILEAKQERFDIAGALAFSVGLVALLFALNQGHAWGWASPMLLMMLTISLVFLVAFLLIEARVPAPMLDLTLFRRRLFSAATSSAVLNYICLYSITFLLPFYLIQGRGLNTAAAGLVLSAQPLVMAITAPLSGTLSDRIGSRFLSTAGMVILAGALFLLSRLSAASAMLEVVLSLMVAGLGVGLFISPNTSALMGSAPRGRQGIASGILATARNVGMVLGIGFAGAIFTTVLARGQGAGPGSSIFDATHISFLASAGVALLGALASFIRGN